MKSTLGVNVRKTSQTLGALRSARIPVTRGEVRGDRYVFRVPARLEERATEALKGRGIECKLLIKGGAYRVKKEAKASAGILLSCVLALACAIICSLFVFRAKVVCDNESTRALIMQIVQEKVGSGVLRSHIDEGLITREIYERAEDAAFVHVKAEGSVLYVNVIMQDAKPPVNEERDNIYASQAGIVEKIAVFSGTAEVSAGDVVKEGDLLISGRRVTGQTDKGEDIYEDCPADGVVVARVWVGGRTQIPAAAARRVRTGEQVSYTLANICGITFGEDGGCEFEDYERRETTRDYAGIPPIKLTYITYYETKTEIYEISEADIEVIAAQKQTEYFSSLAGARVLNTYKNVKKLDNSYALDIYYEVYREISS